MSRDGNQRETNPRFRSIVLVLKFLVVLGLSQSANAQFDLSPAEWISACSALSILPTGDSRVSGKVGDESPSLNALNAEFDFPALPSFSEWAPPSQFCSEIHPLRRSLWRRVLNDHRNFYDGHSIRLLAGGFLAGAAIANTQLDQEIQDHFQVSVRGATSDEWFEFLHANKELGNGIYTLPVFAGAWALGEYFDESPVLVKSSEWGERSLRSFLVGAPPLILAQKLTGGSRPGEHGDGSSHWSLLADNNGVSGHAFMSSLPFINAAKMSENRWLKTTFYAGSLLGPLSRVNDHAHYPSQVALGWWMAFVAASAVDQTQVADGRLRLYPYSTSSGYGALLEFTY